MLEAIVTHRKLNLMHHTLTLYILKAWDGYGEAFKSI